MGLKLESIEYVVFDEADRLFEVCTYYLCRDLSDTVPFALPKIILWIKAGHYLPILL